MTDDYKRSPLATYDGAYAGQALSQTNPDGGISVVGSFNMVSGQATMNENPFVVPQSQYEGPQMVDGLEHRQSGIQITVLDNGNIEVAGYGNPYDGDPMPGMRVEYSPTEGTVTVTNSMAIGADGSVESLQGPEGNGGQQTYNVDFAAGKGGGAALLHSDTVVPTVRAGTADAAVEAANFTELRGGSGNLEATVYDRGRISQGAVSLQYTDPESGAITLMNLDENTVHIAHIGADGAPQQATVEMTGNQVFPENDFRYQGPKPDVPGMGG